MSDETATPIRQGATVPTAGLKHRTAADLRLFVDPLGRLVLVDADGEQHVDAEAVRCFPLTDRRNWIAILDASGHELVTLEDPDQLSSSSMAALESDLARREFMPEILSIQDIQPLTDPAVWSVQTDRGRASITVNGDDDIRALDQSRVLVTDKFGIRYWIRDRKKIDATSRKHLGRYL